MNYRPQDDPYGLKEHIATATPEAVRKALEAVVDELLCAPLDRDYRSAYVGGEVTDAQRAVIDAQAAAVGGIIADVSCAIRIALHPIFPRQRGSGG